MRRLSLALVAIACLWATPASAAIVHVSRAVGGNSALGSSIASGAQTHTAGNMLVALVFHNSTTSITIADDDLNTWVRAGTQQTLNGNSYDVFYAYNINGQVNNVVTVTYTAAVTYRAIVVHEFSGNGSSDPINDFKTGSGTGTAIASSSLTVVASSEVIVGMMIAASDSVVAGTGYTLVNFAVTGDATAYFADEYKIVSASEAASATCASDSWGIVAASFKVAATDTFAPVGSLMLLGVGR